MEKVVLEGTWPEEFRERLSLNSFPIDFRLPRLVARSYGGDAAHAKERKEGCGLEKA